MAFPFSIRYDNRLKTTVTSANKQQLLQYIQQSILKDKADNVTIGDMCVTYKGSTSSWRGSLFGGVDNGVFNLTYKDNSWHLEYQVYTRKLFIGTAILSTIAGIYMGIGVHIWWVWPLAFSWLFGANWLISFARHAGVASDISEGIDELIYGKTERPQHDNDDDKMTGPLKSWF